MSTIILFARAPQLGRVKTRLALGIGDEPALELYVSMLRDSMDKAQILAREIGGQAVLAFTPPEAMQLPPQDGVPSLSELWSASAWPQPEGDLGARMHSAIVWAGEHGAPSVVLLGADTPDMSLANLLLGLTALRNDCEPRELEPPDVIVEPARDGGFWALMCNRALPQSAFELDWSLDETREVLLGNLEAAGLRVRCSSSAEPGDDVDDLRALQRLSDRLRDRPELAPHTSAWLRGNGWL